MRIPTFHLALTLIVGGVVLAGCGNVRPEKTQRTTRDAKTGKTDAETDKSEGKTDADKEVPVTPVAAKNKKAVEKVAGKAAEKSAEESADEALEPSRSALILPTGDRSNSLLAVETIAPKRHQVNRDYQYEIRVTNVSDRSGANVSLANVRVTQRIRGKLTLSGSKVTIKGKDGSEVKGRGPKAQLPTEKDASAVWTFELLEPGDQAVIAVTARGPETGKLLSELGVHYEPLLRLETELAEPTIQLTKTGPKEPVNNSLRIQYTYVLKNKGKEPVRDLIVEDKLAAGLKTSGGDVEAGKEVVTLHCDRLDADAEKKWTVTVEAPKTGTYNSRAVATWPGAAKLSQWQTESQSVATQVRLGKLKIAVQPDVDTQYKSQKVTYTVTVTNEGDAKVERPQIVAKLDKGAQLAQSDPPADGNVWTLPALDPGKTSSAVKIAVRGTAPGKLETKFEASFHCDGQRMSDAASVTTAIKPVDLAALINSSRQQAKQGESLICSLQVTNQGVAPETDLKLSLRLPEIVTYEGIEGESDAKYDDKTRTVTLAVGELKPNESRPLLVRVKAEKGGQGVFAAELTSKALGDTRLSFESQPVTVAAPKSPGKKPVDAPDAKPAKTEKPKDQEKPKTKDQEKPAAEKAKSAPAKKEAEGPAKDTGGSKEKPAQKN